MFRLWLKCSLTILLVLFLCLYLFSVAAKRERVEFAAVCKKYDRRFKVSFGNSPGLALCGVAYLLLVVGV